MFAASAASRRLLSSKLSSLQPNSSRCFSAVVRRTVSKEERVALRAARRERAAKLKQNEGATGSETAKGGGRGAQISSKYLWYAALGVPSVLLVWGFSDENSPPAKVAQMIGLVDFVQGYTDEFARPAYKKLLPDWSQVCTLPSSHLHSRMMMLWKLNFFFFFTDAKCSSRYTHPTYTCS